MIINALITEYNPFHNGHIYHIESSNELTNPDVTIAIMSGQFTQRGEIAITDKFTRAAEVIKHVDLVVELPLYHAISFADDFGAGAVQIADKLQASHIIFGSESGSIATLSHALNMLDEDETDARIKSYMQDGYTYARAVSEALGEDVLSANNILGLSYMKAIKQYAPHITPLTIKRSGNAFNDPALSDKKFSSATSIRNAILSGDAERARKFMPGELLDNIARPTDNNALFAILKIIILTHDADSLRKIYTMEGGLEHRLLSHIRVATSYDEFLHAVKTKRYTRTRLNRLMMYILFNITKDKFAAYEIPHAVRALAMNKVGQNYLQKIKNDVTIATNVNRQNAHYFAPEIMATDIYNTVTGVDKNDFNTPVIIRD
ncbi:nucleotidyltransferase [Aliicoccus persicus]|uniref:tRNA(Met) cytidine acetate ligase n=1 Tax=Aliicoccus persicus TaxID=930138 RepID=A0A662Z055_9STAP|nr:nucleotidyltransferase [Aliicoccus persicus]SEV80498.1 Predicted nucleotidyltransferase [Aliicoccus persicus]